MGAPRAAALRSSSLKKKLAGCVSAPDLKKNRH
jgi:hypothetical protein